jgi:3-deoxy-D-manno-octulosonate 8-phosphate phosphatase KdsC-like HAD superfamily phosphatase
LAEKQFDLVSRTLEQQQQQENQLKTYNTNDGDGQKAIKEEGIEKVASGSGSRKLVTDPRKDPRMKTTEGKETRADAVGR